MNARIRIMLTFDLSSALIEKKIQWWLTCHIMWVNRINLWDSAKYAERYNTLPIMANHFEKLVIIGTTFKFMTHTPTPIPRPSQGQSQQKP